MCEENEDTSSRTSSETNLGSDVYPEVLIPQKAIFGFYQKTSFDKDIWSDIYHPTVRLQGGTNAINKQFEQNGILTLSMIASGSTYIDRAPITNKFVRCKCVLSGKLVSNINIISWHRHLAYLDLSWNRLSSLGPLRYLPCLMYLDASHNNLTVGFDFTAPHNLITANLSYNKISKYCNIINFWSLVNVDLSHNVIHEIDPGFQKLRYLRNLNLSYNEIEILQNLQFLNIVSLNLEHNRIVFGKPHDKSEKVTYEDGERVSKRSGEEPCKEEKVLEIINEFEKDTDLTEVPVIPRYDDHTEEMRSFKTMEKLTIVNLASNKLATLCLFRQTANLEKINFSSNKLVDLSELNHLRGLRYVVELDLRNNPVCDEVYYHESVISSVPHVKLLDGKPVDMARKVQIGIKFNPSFKVEAAHRYTKLQMLDQFINPPVNALVPVNLPPPLLIVLVGLPGGKHEQLAEIFCRENRKHVRLVKTYTTRERTNTIFDSELEVFVSVEEFGQLVRTGKLITVSEEIGYDVGISDDEFTYHKAALICTDLVSALTLRFRSLKPILILALPETEELHRLWLKREGPKIQTHGNYDQLNYRPRSFTVEILDSRERFTRFITQKTLKSRREYLDFHRNNPGVIEATVYTNNVRESLKKLRNILKKCLHRQSNVLPSYTFKKDPCYERMISDKITYLFDLK